MSDKHSQKAGDKSRKLSEEDQARVNEYLSSPVHQVERKPFRPLLLLFWLWVVVAALGGVSLIFGRVEGYL
ncbi:MAG: DUF3094 domain-containing protein [Porticoccaceae bacterium]|nr:DUF3094 domain-containing protein [Porticoccaceae bacterium]